MCQLEKGLIVSNFSKKYKKELAVHFFGKKNAGISTGISKFLFFLNYSEPETPKVSVLPEILPPGPLSFP